MTHPVVDAAWVAGGVLTATGDLAADVSAEAATERLTAALEPGGAPARWAPPDLGDVTRLESVLVEAWTAVSGALSGAGWDAPAVRLRVPDTETLAALGRVSPSGPPVVAHVELHASRLAWRWPVRVGLAAADLGESVDFGPAEVRVIGTGDDEPIFELVIVAGDGADVPAGVRGGCVVVLGGSVDELDGGLVGGLDAAAVVVCPGSDVTWLAAAIRHLACGRPLDVAVGLARPDATMLADEEFLEMTSGRAYGRMLADQLRASESTVVGDAVAALDRLVEAPFDAAGGSGATLADVVSSMTEAGLGELTTVERHLQRATANGGGRRRTPPPPPPAPPAAVPPPPSPPPSSPPGGGAPRPGSPPPDAMTGGADGVGDEMMEVGDGDAVGVGADDGGAHTGSAADVDRGEAEAAPVEAAPDARRLQARVVNPATNEVLADRFVAGKNQLKVRIAAKGAEGAATADVAFASPTPGRAAKLTVEIIAGATHSSQELELPAIADSKWTRAVAFEVPVGTATFRVFIQVLFQDRVVQSATLSGPVLDAGAPAPAEGLRLSVDASTPPAAVHRMTPAGASLTIVPGLTGEPHLLRLGEKRPIDPDHLAAASKALRQTLLGAFRSPPPSLEAAAGVLTRLAVYGSALHQQLEAGDYDAVEWIHVSTFGAADMPVELVYTHPMPDSDDRVPVCPTALAGADRCVADCPDRARSDVVCPFGFWGTSKVVERRAHTDDRTAAVPGVERSIQMLAVGAAGVSKKADEVDSTSTSRIVEAVRKAVAGGTFHPLGAWADLKPVAALPARVLVLITHTIEGAAGDVLGIKLQLGSDDLALHRIGKSYVNPTGAEPGPVVLAIGCDTGELEASFADYVGLLFGAGAELVVSAISPVPGKNVADFVVRLFESLPGYLAQPGIHRFGEVLTDIRRQTVARGDVLALALTATGDADVSLVGILTAVVTIELLPAGYGDAVLVTYGAAGAEPHRILIDGGQAKSFPAVAARLRSFQGPIDLLVVTHVDTDHIGGAVRLLASKALPARFGGIWFNGFVHLNAARGMLGPIHGEKLTALIVKSGLPWNQGWPWPDGVPEGVPAGVGGPVVVGDKLPVIDLPGGATATLLSPTPQKLLDLLPVWEEVVEKAGLRPDVAATEDEETSVVAPGLLGGITLEDLAAFDTDDDRAEANGSSIAFLFEFEDVRILFGADAHADALVAGLTALAGAEDGGKVRLDACKLPHHGSKGNCTRAMVDLIDCPLWMISTNGRRFHHPDDEALARVVHGRDHPQLVWNYRSDRFAAFTKEYPPETSGYTVVVPDEGAEGITIQLGG